MTQRSKRNQFIMWVVLAVMVIAMGGYGLSSSMSQSHTNTAIRVGETEISADEYYNTLSARLNRISREQGTALSFEEARLLGIPNQVKTQLVNQATMSEIARRANIRATNEAVTKELLAIEGFHDVQGNFSRENFELFLRSRNLSEDQFLSEIRADLERNMVLNILDAQSLDMPAFSDAIADMVGERRGIRYLSIDEASISAPPAPSDAEIRARYDADPEQYMAEPVREYEIAYLIADPAQISDIEIARLYRENSDQYEIPARASYEVLAFPDEASANAFFASPDFAFEAGNRGLDDADYRFSSQPLDALPEALQNDIKIGGAKLYPPVQALLGWNVYNVTDYQAAQIKPLETVKEDIRNDLASSLINEKLTPEYENIVDFIAGGSTPDGLAQNSALEFVKWKSDEAPIRGLTDQNAFISEARAAQIGDPRDLVKLQNGGVFYLKAISEQEPKPHDFEDVRSEIAAEIKAEAINQSLDQKAEELVRLATNSNLEQVADREGVSLQTIEPVSSQEAYSKLPLPLAFELFNQETEKLWIAEGETSRYIAQINDVESFDANTQDGEALLAEIRNQITSTTSEALILDYLNAAAQEFGASQFPAIIEQVEAQIQ